MARLRLGCFGVSTQPRRLANLRRVAFKQALNHLSDVERRARHDDRLRATIRSETLRSTILVLFDEKSFWRLEYRDPSGVAHERPVAANFRDFQKGLKAKTILSCVRHEPIGPRQGLFDLTAEKPGINRLRHERRFNLQAYASLGAGDRRNDERAIRTIDDSVMVKFDRGWRRPFSEPLKQGAALRENLQNLIQHKASHRTGRMNVRSGSGTEINPHAEAGH